MTRLKDADALMIATEWSEFRTPDFNKMKSLLKDNVIFDGRNLFDIIPNGGIWIFIMKVWEEE